MEPIIIDKHSVLKHMLSESVYFVNFDDLTIIQMWYVAEERKLLLKHFNAKERIILEENFNTEIGYAIFQYWQKRINIPCFSLNEAVNSLKNHIAPINLI